VQIEPFTKTHEDDVVAMSLRAWAPVFASLEQVFEPAVYQDFHPKGWEAAQEESVRATVSSQDFHTWVAVEEGAVAGFVAVKFHSETFGEIYMIAVDPAYQRRGVAMQLTNFALEWLKNKGVTVTMVETGGDPGHGPARATYEKAGFRLFPVARYFKKL